MTSHSNQSSSLLIKNISHQHQSNNRLLNANLLTNSNANSNNSISSMINNSGSSGQTTNTATTTAPSQYGGARKKSINALTNSLNLSNLTSGAPGPTLYNFSSGGNINASSNNAIHFPSMVKANQSTNSFIPNRKYNFDYQQAVRFDYTDAFVNNPNIDFLNRIAQMQRLQFDTIEWERKKKKKAAKNLSKANLANANIAEGKPSNTNGTINSD